MSNQSLEVVRAAIEAFNRRDGQGIDALLAEDAEIVPVRAAVEGTTYRGRDAGSQYCAAANLTWANLRWELEEVRQGVGWVLALGRIRGRGRGSGVDIDVTAGWVVRLRDGQIKSLQTCPNRAKALEAVGLRE